MNGSPDTRDAASRVHVGRGARSGSRGRGVEAFYGQRHGELVPRDYRLIDRFEPLPETRPAPSHPS